MKIWAVSLGSLCIFAANAIFLNAKDFLRRQGFPVKWWDRSLPNKVEIQKLASDRNFTVAEKAKNHLLFLKLSWFILSVGFLLFLYGTEAYTIIIGLFINIIFLIVVIFLKLIGIEI
jgi:hypothetical protein